MSQQSQPVLPGQRLEILDIIRGFAIFGILMANIHSWSGYRFIPFELLKTLPYYEYNDLLKMLFMVCIDMKFYTLFSLLFGIGFYLQFHKHVHDQAPFLRFYRRRLAFLMLFGALHAFFWSGDILFIYALMGFVLIYFRNLSMKTLFFSAIFIYYGWLLYDLYYLLNTPEIHQMSKSAYKHYADISPWEVTQVFKEGSLFAVLQMNWHNLYWRYIDLVPSGRINLILAIFILGMFLMRIHYFSRYVYSVQLLLFFLVTGSTFSYVAYEMGGFMAQFSTSMHNIGYKSLNITGQVLLAMAYIHILAQLYKVRLFKPFLGLFAYVGRMSFSNYLMHTFFGYLIFYPFFGGLFGTLGLVEITVMAVGLYLLQIVLSMLWLQFFTFGPLEWLWRSLSYQKVLPNKKRRDDTRV